MEWTSRNYGTLVWGQARDCHVPDLLRSHSALWMLFVDAKRVSEQRRPTIQGLLLNLKQGAAFLSCSLRIICCQFIRAMTCLSFSDEGIFPEIGLQSSSIIRIYYTGRWGEVCHRNKLLFILRKLGRSPCPKSMRTVGILNERNFDKSLVLLLYFWN